MAPVMAIGSEVFGGCIEGIDASAMLKNRVVGLVVVGNI